MIQRALRALSEGFLYIREHPQFLFTLLLIVVVPIAFLLSGQQFLNASKESQERLEKDRIGIMHDVFASYMTAVDFNQTVLQAEIETLAAQNTDITEFVVAKDTDEGVLIIASLRTDRAGTVAENPEPYRSSLLNAGGSVIRPHTVYGTRYWQSFRLIRSNNTNFYIFTETSLENIDNLIANRVQDAYYWLVGLLALVMVLLFRHVKLIDYSYLYQEVKKANEMKDLFTNMIAHELRAPLTAMRGYGSMIRENKEVSREVSEYATRIEDAAERLIVIVSDLLDVARIQSGKLSIEKTTVEITTVIDSVIDALSPSAQEKNVTIACEGIRSPLKIQGDAKRLNQALTNLVSNAIKYTPKGSIVISLEDRKDRVELRVKDTGMGIRAEDQKSLFAPFFRVQAEDVSKITGTGLGMWITKQLIELMGGSIGVESIRGVGTHVVVTLPK